MIFKDYGSRKRDFEHWYQSALGRVLLASERQSSESHVSGLFGYHHLEISVSHRLPLCTSANFGHRVCVVPQHEAEQPEGTLVCDAEELPLANECFDLVVMHHALDFSPNPHQALREAARVLKGNGHVMIVGFNPLSSWGVRKLMSRRGSAPWSGRFISVRRLHDWLSLLDFEVEKTHYAFAQPPLRNPVLLERFRFLEFFVRRGRLPMGAYYVIVAQKRVGSMMPLRKQWRRASVVALPVSNSLSGSVGKPLSRQGQDE